MEEHQQIRGLQPQLVAATPGRLLDHLQKGNLLADNIQTLVIDEFDKSLELGFRQQMQSIIELLPHLQQRILISATDTDDIPAFVGSHNYARLNFLDNENDERIGLHIVQSPEKDKLQTLYRLLGTLGTQKSLVFVGYRESVERVGNFLKEKGFTADIFHGGMEQRDRERALYRFTNGSANILVSTDLASRGLDITDIDNAIHYHLPPNEETSTHRNGRTARWDMKGSAYFILGPEEHLPQELHLPAAGAALPWTDGKTPGTHPETARRYGRGTVHPAAGYCRRISACRRGRAGAQNADRSEKPWCPHRGRRRRCRLQCRTATAHGGTAALACDIETCSAQILYRQCGNGWRHRLSCLEKTAVRTAGYGCFCPLAANRISTVCRGLKHETGRF